MNSNLAKVINAIRAFDLVLRNTEHSPHEFSKKSLHRCVLNWFYHMWSLVRANSEVFESVWGLRLALCEVAGFRWNKQQQISLRGWLHDGTLMQTLPSRLWVSFPSLLLDQLWVRRNLSLRIAPLFDQFTCLTICRGLPRSMLPTEEGFKLMWFQNSQASAQGSRTWWSQSLGHWGHVLLKALK